MSTSSKIKVGDTVERIFGYDYPERGMFGRHRYKVIGILDRHYGLRLVLEGIRDDWNPNRFTIVKTKTSGFKRFQEKHK